MKRKKHMKRKKQSTIDIVKEYEKTLKAPLYGLLIAEADSGLVYLPCEDRSDNRFINYKFGEPKVIKKMTFHIDEIETSDPEKKDHYLYLHTIAEDRKHQEIIFSTVYTYLGMWDDTTPEGRVIDMADLSKEEYKNFINLDYVDVDLRVRTYLHKLFSSKDIVVIDENVIAFGNIIGTPRWAEKYPYYILDINPIANLAVGKRCVIDLEGKNIITPQALESQEIYKITSIVPTLEGIYLLAERIHGDLRLYKLQGDKLSEDILISESVPKPNLPVARLAGYKENIPYLLVHVSHSLETIYAIALTSYGRKKYSGLDLSDIIFEKEEKVIDKLHKEGLGRKKYEMPCEDNKKVTYIEEMRQDYNNHRLYDIQIIKSYLYPHRIINDVVMYRKYFKTKAYNPFTHTHRITHTYTLNIHINRLIIEERTLELKLHYMQDIELDNIGYKILAVRPIKDKYIHQKLMRM